MFSLSLQVAIDLTILAESIPKRWGFILSSLATIWGVGNAITGLVAWPLLVNFGCPGGSTSETCARSENMGWRYLYITLGGNRCGVFRRYALWQWTP